MRQTLCKNGESQQNQPKCDGSAEYAYPGVYKNKLSVFEELEEMDARV